MNQSEDQTPLFSKKRKLSRFLAQEMLYDYIDGKLDGEREAAVKEYLTQDDDLRQEEESMRQAKSYCELLSQVEISEPLNQQVGSSRSATEIIVDKLGWSRWPDPAKWLAEALALSGVVAMIAVFLPWQKLGFDLTSPKSEVVLLEKENDKVVAINDTKAPEDIENKMAAAIETKNEKVKQQIAEKIKEQQPVPTQPKADPKVVAANQMEKKKAAAVQLEQKKKKVVKAAAQGNPFVYRGVLQTADLDGVTALLVEKLNGLGAKKGGKVEIGWRKPNAAYFHFILDEEHLATVKQSFSEQGTLTINKTAHRRVMPAGKIRFIIEVKDANIN